MAVTYEPLATTTLTATSTTITFSSISGSYTDLRLVFVGTTNTSSPLWAQYNSDTGANYSQTDLYGNGTTATSKRGSGDAYHQLVGADATNLSATIPKLVTVDIFSYAGSTFKTSLFNQTGDTNGTGETTVNIGLWRSTAAITAIKLLTAGSNYFNIDTSATLYGILKA